VGGRYGREYMTDGEVLVALLRDLKDFSILQTEGWYRIPLAHTPKRWPPEYLAFYQPRAFKGDAFRIRYFGKVAQTTTVARRDLFPNELESQRSNKLYHCIKLEHLEALPQPIPCRLARKVVFIPTTWHKFITAEELNDLFDESPLEDLLWDELKRRKIPAHRQWPILVERCQYFLDFALFCHKANVDIEADGDSWHIKAKRADRDNRRNNALEAHGWHVLRFNTQQVQEQFAEYCLPKIQDSINTLGGLQEDGLVPRKFIEKDGESAQQLSLFEEAAPYTADFD